MALGQKFEQALTVSFGEKPNPAALQGRPSYAPHFAPLLDALRSHKGEWARVNGLPAGFKQSGRQNVAARIKDGRYAGPGFEANVIRTEADPQGELWVRYTGVEANGQVGA